MKTKSKNRNTITFRVIGYVTQHIQIVDPEITMKELKKGLNRGEFNFHITGGDICSILTGKVVARIRYVNYNKLNTRVMEEKG